MDVLAAAFSPDGQTILTGGAGEARLWEAATGKPVGRPLAHAGEVRAVAFSPDGKRILTGGGNLEREEVRLWEAATGQLLGSFDHPKTPLDPAMAAPDDQVRAAAFRPDGFTFLTATGDRTALWEALPVGSVSRAFQHESDVEAIAVSPDGRTVATGSTDKTARLWDAITRAPLTPPLEHRDWVHSVTFSPDGRKLLTTAGVEARLWEVPSGRPIGRPLLHASGPVAAAFSPDGKAVLTGAAVFERGETQLWDATTGKALGSPLTRQAGARVLACSPDGRTVVTVTSAKAIRPWSAAPGFGLSGGSSGMAPPIAGAVPVSSDKRARLWNAATGAPIGPPLEHPGAVTTAAFSRDGKLLLTTSEWSTKPTEKGRPPVLEREPRLWEAATGKLVGQPLRHPGWVNFVAFSPDGKTVVTCGSDKAARLWDAGTGRLIGAPLQHSSAVSVAGFSPDGKTLLTVGLDHKTRLWEAATGKPVGPDLPLAVTPAMEIAFSPDGRRIVTRSRISSAPEGNVLLWDAMTGKSLGPPLPHPGHVEVLAFSPDGKTVGTGGSDGTARLWDAATGRPIGQALRHRAPVRAVAFSPDGKVVLTGSSDHTAGLWDADTGQPLGPPLRQQAMVTYAAFSRDGKTVLTGGLGGAHLWEVATGRLVGDLRQHASVRNAVFSPDGTTVLIESFDFEGGEARLWDAATGQPVGEPIEHPAPVHSVAFSPDGRTILTGSGIVVFQGFVGSGDAMDFGNEARLWERETSLPVGLPMRHEHQVLVAAFSTDGKTILTGTPGEVRLWDAASAKPAGPPIRTQQRHLGPPILALSPDARAVVMEGPDTTAQVWDTTTGQPLGSPLRHKEPFTAAAFSPDGRLLVTGAGKLFDIPRPGESEPRGEVRLWEAATGKPLGALPHAAGPVRAVTFSTDGKSVLIASGNESRLWALPGPLPGSVERITLWVQGITGTELDDGGKVRVLDAAARLERGQRLRDAGGPPGPAGEGGAAP
jgi:WD40 repeat protein